MLPGSSGYYTAVLGNQNLRYHNDDVTPCFHSLKYTRMPEPKQEASQSLVNTFNLFYFKEINYFRMTPTSSENQEWRVAVLPNKVDDSSGRGIPAGSNWPTSASQNSQFQIYDKTRIIQISFAFSQNVCINHGSDAMHLPPFHSRIRCLASNVAFCS